MVSPSQPQSPPEGCSPTTVKTSSSKKPQPHTPSEGCSTATNTMSSSPLQKAKPRIAYYCKKPCMPKKKASSASLPTAEPRHLPMRKMNTPPKWADKMQPKPYKQQYLESLMPDRPATPEPAECVIEIPAEGFPESSFHSPERSPRGDGNLSPWSTPQKSESPTRYQRLLRTPPPYVSESECETDESDTDYGDPFHILRVSELEKKLLAAAPSSNFRAEAFKLFEDQSGTPPRTPDYGKWFDDKMEEWNTEHERKEDEVEEDPSKDEKFDDEFMEFMRQRVREVRHLKRAGFVFLSPERRTVKEMYAGKKKSSRWRKLTIAAARYERREVAALAEADRQERLRIHRRSCNLDCHTEEFDGFTDKRFEERPDLYEEEKGSSESGNGGEWSSEEDYIVRATSEEESDEEEAHEKKAVKEESSDEELFVSKIVKRKESWEQNYRRRMAERRKAAAKVVVVLEEEPYDDPLADEAYDEEEPEEDKEEAQEDKAHENDVPQDATQEKKDDEEKADENKAHKAEADVSDAAKEEEETHKKEDLKSEVEPQATTSHSPKPTKYRLFPIFHRLAEKKETGEYKKGVKKIEQEPKQVQLKKTQAAKQKQNKRRPTSPKNGTNKKTR